MRVRGTQLDFDLATKFVAFINSNETNINNIIPGEAK